MIRFIAAGLFTTIQDLGRFGYRELGVPVSGAMDLQAATNANLLLGNAPQLAVLEFTASGPVLEFEEPARIAICGASFVPKLNGLEIAINRPIEIPSGGILSFGRPSKGFRAYLAIQDGFISDKVLGSASFYNGITDRSQFSKGDVIQFNLNAQSSLPSFSSELDTAMNFEKDVIEVYKGPEFDQLPQEIQLLLNDGAYTVAPNSSRMAYILDHSEAISAKEIITAPVQPGTVQLTPSGKLIVLMRDAQTTGGYARILQLTESAINFLAQNRAGNSVRFKIIDPLSDTPV